MDRSEKDDSSLIDLNGIKQKPYFNGASQWLDTLGRFDMYLSVTSMSPFRCAPRKGYLDCLKSIYGYPCRNPDGATNFRTKINYYVSFAVTNKYEKNCSVYGKASEEITSDVPILRGKDK
jgi:hypothetical protein